MVAAVKVVVIFFLVFAYVTLYKYSVVLWFFFSGCLFFLSCSIQKCGASVVIQQQQNQQELQWSCTVSGVSFGVAIPRAPVCILVLRYFVRA